VPESRRLRLLQTLSFYKYNAWFPDYLVRHGIFNYWQVLKKVVYSPQQAYNGEVTGLNGMTLQSTILPTTQTECDAVLAEEMMAKALKMGAKPR